MELTSYIFLGVDIVLIVISSVVAFIKRSKNKDNAASYKTSALTAKLLAMIPNLVSQAENLFGAGKGANKLSWVMQSLTIQALKEGFSIDEEAMTKAVNDVVDATKNVNVISVNKDN